MSPLNRGPLMGSRIPPTAMRPPMLGYGRVPPPPLPGRTSRGMPMPPINPMFGHRGRPLPPPPRPGPMMARPGVPPGPPMFGHRGRPVPPMPPMPPMGLRGPIGPRGPMIRPGPRGVLPPHVLPHMRPRFLPSANGKGKLNTTKKASKIEELELKKPWMTDEIRSEIQKKNKLYAKAKKNKDAKEWEEFKDLRNKVTRMIRDAKNEYLAKNPEQAHLYESDDGIEENDEDENQLDKESEDESSDPYCETCDRDFQSEEMLQKHLQEHRICNIDGCKFTAHPKIVDKHISMQHETGLYARMKKEMSDGDIEKWREERKRRYPTANNIKFQEAQRLEKKKRGEVIKNQTQNVRGSFKKDQVRKNRKRRRPKIFQNKVSEEIAERETYRGLLPFAGTSTIDENEKIYDSSVENEDKTIKNDVAEESKFVVSDEEESQILDQQSTVNEITKPEILICQNLSLVADYGSESDNDEPPDEVPAKVIKLNEDVVIESGESTNKVIENPDANINIKENSLSNNNKTKVNKNVKRNDGSSLHNKNKNIFEDKKKSSKSNKYNNSELSNGRLRLLNKLLARSIQHERNAIFQCITFIAKNNFFD